MCVLFEIKNVISTTKTEHTHLCHDITDPPDAPENPEIKEMYKDHCLFTWQSPNNDGGSPVTGYFVERCMAPSARWMSVNKEPTTGLETKVGDLIEDNEYQFRVSAENKIGRGPPSIPTKPALAKDPWGKLIIL